MIEAAWPGETFTVLAGRNGSALNVLVSSQTGNSSAVALAVSHLPAGAWRYTVRVISDGGGVSPTLISSGVVPPGGALAFDLAPPAVAFVQVYMSGRGDLPKQMKTDDAEAPAIPSVALPSAVAAAVARALLANQSNFFYWEGGQCCSLRAARGLVSDTADLAYSGWQYGSAVVVDGIYDAAAQFGAAFPPAGVAAADSWSDNYFLHADKHISFDCSAKVPYGAANHTKACAYQQLHNVSIPQGGTIGNHLPLYPVAYLHRHMRVLAAGGPHAASGAQYEQDVAVLLRTAQQYVLGWPTRLQDGTVARAGGPGANDLTLWADDQFMGIATLCCHVPLHNG